MCVSLFSCLIKFMQESLLEYKWTFLHKNYYSPGLYCKCLQLCFKLRFNRPPNIKGKLVSIPDFLLDPGLHKYAGLKSQFAALEDGMFWSKGKPWVLQNALFCLSYYPSTNNDSLASRAWVFVDNTADYITCKDSWIVAFTGKSVKYYRRNTTKNDFGKTESPRHYFWPVFCLIGR